MATRPTVLIAGASGTLGGGIARELAGRGYDLGLHYHSHKDAVEPLAAEAAAKGAKALCYASDFLDPASVPALSAAFLKDFTRLDALVWAAGITREAPVIALKDADLRAVLNVDLKAFFLLLKAFSRQFTRQKSGCVVALSSHAGAAGRAGGAAYAMAHSGLQATVKSAAREWGALNIRVNAVLPPFVPESGMGRSASPQFSASVQAKRLLKTNINAADATAVFVADLIENPAISGQVLSVDSRII